jgi:hypothetical protein
MEQKTTGFASPAQVYEEEDIALNRLLIPPPQPILDSLKQTAWKLWAYPAAPC